MKEIPLTQGFTAIVDDEDYEAISQHRWFAHVHQTSVYAYRNIKLGNGKFTLQAMHRLVLERAAGQPLPRRMHVDHINRNGIDNRRGNLRLATPTQNQANQRKRQHTRSRFKGVAWNQGKWRVFAGGEYCGSFTDEIEAARAYDAAASRKWGEFASLNFADASAANADT